MARTEENMAWYLLAWQRATDFSGRSRRKEYWMFQLFNLLVVIFVFGLALLAGGDTAVKLGADFCFAYCLIAFVPTLAVTVRRLHDTGRSGYWYFISFIPLIGGIILLVLTVLDGDPDRNEYGPNPKVPEDIKVAI
jgi:uncharacterized membrane protein YhaH (DUF805 family)